MAFLDILVMSGRAVLYPVYEGSYERQVPGLQFTDATETSAYAELATKWVQDAMRSLDYLETRPEINADRLEAMRE